MYTGRVPPNDLYEVLLAQIREEFPGFRVVCKDRAPTQRAIHLGLLLVTAGRMRSYLSGYQTTLRRTVYVTPDWDRRDARERYITMRHERVHLRQFQRYGLLGMALLYVFLPLPMGLSYFRARFEQEAYTESIRAAAEIYGLEYVRSPRFRERIVSQFLGASYGWMWPFRRRVEAWYESVLSGLSAECDGA
ncbi:hypothetical protein Hoch_6055 [Haliangium ochraceum DSM 14365]|uniref:DUF4157 domain-containing protein n=1 Tax=Haliangium ochraceum (strain DSM 14365 / JCM 11303 / SMP-2) TaxID=502025 RepID=D0LL34_HALO1|nr:hypothetical protein Hoch_6055 [Haliangium ochraceum DSM 14365]